MNEETKNVFGQIVRLLSACVSLGALVMFFYILYKSGILPPSEISGPNKQYEQGWALFFFLILGIPCLAVFAAGLAPWIIWGRNRRKQRKAGTTPPED